MPTPNFLCYENGPNWKENMCYVSRLISKPAGDWSNYFQQNVYQPTKHVYHVASCWQHCHHGLYCSQLAIYYMLTCTTRTSGTMLQIEYLLGGSSKNGSHVYFLLIVAMVILLWSQIVLLWHQVIMVGIRTTFISHNSITQKTCNRKYTWLPFLILPPSGFSIWGTEN